MKIENWERKLKMKSRFQNDVFILFHYTFKYKKYIIYYLEVTSIYKHFTEEINMVLHQIQPKVVRFIINYYTIIYNGW